MRERLVALKKTQNELEQGLQLLSHHWHPLNISEKVPRKSVASMLNICRIYLPIGSPYLEPLYCRKQNTERTKQARLEL